MRSNLLTDPQAGGFPLVSWKAIFAGLFVALFSYMTLMAFGTAIGGSAASGIIEESGRGGGLALGAVIWMMVAGFVSLAIGSYFASRIANFVNKRLGSYQGAIIASLFFALLIYGATSTLGAIGGQVGSLASAVSGGASSLAANPRVQSIVERSFGEDLTLRDEPQVVAQGLAVRLLQGNDDAARNYLAYQTGRSRIQIEQRFNDLRNEFSATAQQIGSEVASDVSTAGWVLFGTLVLGMLFSVLGGAWGASVNLNRPLDDDADILREPLSDPQAV